MEMFPAGRERERKKKKRRWATSFPSSPNLEASRSHSTNSKRETAGIDLFLGWAPSMPVNGQQVSLFFPPLLLAIIILTPPISLFQALSWHWWGSIQSMEKKKHGRLSASAFHIDVRSPIHNGQDLYSSISFHRLTWKSGRDYRTPPPLLFYNDFILDTHYAIIQDRCGIGIIASAGFLSATSSEQQHGTECFVVL